VFFLSIDLDVVDLFGIGIDLHLRKKVGTLMLE
jgi:hypothetical protein